MYCYVILAHKNLMHEECSYLDNSFEYSDILKKTWMSEQWKHVNGLKWIQLLKFGPLINYIK